MPAKLSIIMPVRNAAPFLVECLDSIVEQSYQDWELLAVDDGSTDESLKLLEDYAEADQRIKVFSQGALGIIPALRLAYSKSSGNWISRMDADDHMHVDKLKALMLSAERVGKGHLIVGKVAYFHAEQLGEGYRRYAGWLNDLQADRWQEMYKECVIPSPCWVTHREDLDRAGAFEHNDYPEDYDLCFRFQEAGLKVSFAPKALHYWRDHPMRSSRNDPNYADNRFLDIKLKYFLHLSKDQDRQLALWGGGQKGKIIAKKLQAAGVNFIWLSNNVGQIGQKIYGIEVQSDFSEKVTFKDRQIIVAIAGRDQAAIKNRLANYELEAGKDFFFFA